MHGLNIKVSPAQKESSQAAIRNPQRTKAISQ
jgi:hypothetical protein